MRGKKTSEVIREQIEKLLTARNSEELPAALKVHLKVLKIHLEGLDPEGVVVSPRTVARIRAEAKKAGKPYRPTPEGVKHAKKLSERKEGRKQKLDRAIEAFRAGATYKKAAGDAGISVSTLYRHCRAERERETDQPRKEDEKPSKKARR